MADTYFIFIHQMAAHLAAVLWVVANLHDENKFKQHRIIMTQYHDVKKIWILCSFIYYTNWNSYWKANFSTM